MKRLFLIFGALFLGLMSGVINISAQEDNPKTINGGLISGRARSLPKPEYPDEAKKARVSGTVTVEVLVDEEGNVVSAKAVVTDKTTYTIDGNETIVEKTEEPAEVKLLREAAENAAKKAKFAPVLLSGKPVRVRGVIVYNFVADSDIHLDEIKGGILNGKAVSLPKPEYPDEAKKVNVGGAVTVQVVIDEEGNVISAQAVSGHPLLRQAAVNAARQAKFSPTFLKGQPVKVSGLVVYNFAL